MMPLRGISCCARRITQFIPTIVRRRSDLAMRASLPMYDLPNLRAATDAWWLGVAQAAARRGLGPVPLGLDRSDPPGNVWRRHDLVLSQCCGRDLVTHLAGQVAPVAIPSYRAAGCSAGTYRSWLVAGRGDARRKLDAFVGATAAVNYTGSHSGWVALGMPWPAPGCPSVLWPGCLHGRSSRLAAGGRSTGRPISPRSIASALLCSSRPSRRRSQCADRGRKRACPGATLHHRRRPSGRQPEPGCWERSWTR